MKYWILMAAMAFVANAAAAQYVDDLYGPSRTTSTTTKNKRTSAPSVSSNHEAQAAVVRPTEAQLENKELITSYSEALTRRVLAMRNASYDQPESYWTLLEQYQTMLERKYDQHLYNIVVVGDQMWVEPQSITAQFDGSDPAAGVIQYNEDVRHSKDQKPQQTQRASNDGGQVNINLNVDPWSMNVWPSVSYTTTVAPNVNISIGFGGGSWGWPYSYNRWPYYGGYYGGYYGPSYGWGWPYHGGGYYPYYRPYYGGYYGGGYYGGGYYGGGNYGGYYGNPKGTYYGNSRHNDSYRGGGNYRGGGGGGHVQGLSGGRPSGRPNGSNTVYGITGGRADRPSGVAGSGVTTSRPSGRPNYNSNSERPSGNYERPSRTDNRQNTERTERPTFNRQNTERQNIERPSYDRPSSSPSTFSRPSGVGGGGGGAGGGRPRGR